MKGHHEMADRLIGAEEAPSVRELSTSEIQEVAKGILDYVDAFCKKHQIPYYLIGGALIGAIREGDLVPWDDDIDIAMIREDYERFCDSFVDSEQYKLCEFRKTRGYRHGAAKVVDKSTCFSEPGTRSKDSGIFIDVFPLDHIASNARARIIPLMIYKKMYLYSHVFSKEATHSNIVKNGLRLVLSNTMGLIPPKKLLNRVTKHLKRSKGKCLINYWGAWDSKECGPAEWFESAIAVTLGERFYPAPVGYDCWLKQVYGNYMIRPESPSRSHGRAWK